MSERVTRCHISPYMGMFTFRDLFVHVPKLMCHVSVPTMPNDLSHDHAMVSDVTRNDKECLCTDTKHSMARACTEQPLSHFLCI